MTFIDTANVYGGGANEKLIAGLLANRRDEVTLATKFGIVGNPADRAAGRPAARGDAAYVRQCIDESLGRLKPTSSTSTTCTDVTSPCRSRRPSARWPNSSPPARSATLGYPR